MSNYEGVLGDSALGEVTLGGYETSVILTARVTQSLFEILYVGPQNAELTQFAIDLFYLADPDAVVSQTVLEILSQRSQSALMTQQVAEVLDAYNPNLRATQIVAEVVSTYTPAVRLTEQVAEVIDVYDPSIRMTAVPTEVMYQYIAPSDVHLTVGVVVSQSISHSSLVNKSVVSAIVVAQTIAGQSYSQAVTSTLAVAQTVAFRNTVAHLSVTSSLAVSQTVKINEDRVLSVVSAIAVSPTIQVRTQTVSLSVQSNIAVAQTVTKNDVVNLSVTSALSVSSVVLIHDPEVTMNVTSSIAVAHSIAARNTVIRISMLQPIGATQSSAEKSDHLFIEDDIGVDCLIVSRNTNVRADLFSTLTLTATVFARSTIIHESVISTIAVTPSMVVFNPNIALQSDVAVAQLIATRNTVVRLSLESGITVTTAIRHSPNEQQLQSDIHVDGSGFGTAIKLYTTPLPYTFVQPIYLTDTIAGGNSNRQITVQQDIAVTPTIRTNHPTATVLSEVQIAQTIAGGRDTREIALRDTIAVGQTITSRNGIVKQTIRQPIAVKHTILDQTEEIELALAHAIIVNPTISLRVIPSIRLTQAIEIHQIVLARPDVNNQFVTNAIAVAQNIRSSPNYQAIVQQIAVSSRVRQLFQSVLSAITVDQTLNQERSRLLIQKLPITQVLTANRILNRSIRSEITVTPTIRANHDYIRNMVTRVPIAESFYPRFVDFNETPILVPVATGVIVSATLMSIRGQHGIIVLPAAQLGDSVQNIGKVEVRKSMDGTAYSYIQNTDRKKLTYKWLLAHLKVYELRTFVRSSISDLLRLENWKGEIWMVKITKNPFEFQNQGVWEKDGEYAEVEMVFEGVQIA